MCIIIFYGIRPVAKFNATPIKASPEFISVSLTRGFSRSNIRLCLQLRKILHRIQNINKPEQAKSSSLTEFRENRMKKVIVPDI